MSGKKGRKGGKVVSLEDFNFLQKVGNNQDNIVNNLEVISELKINNTKLSKELKNANANIKDAVVSAKELQDKYTNEFEVKIKQISNLKGNIEDQNKVIYNKEQQIKVKDTVITQYKIIAICSAIGNIILGIIYFV